MIVFGVGTLYGIPLTTNAGVAVVNPTPVQLGVLQDASGDLSFDEKTLYGAYQMPVAFGRGKGKLAFKAKAANFNAQSLGSLFFGVTPTAGIQATFDGPTQPSVAVPTSPYTITPTPPSTGTVLTDLGVIYASTGLAFTRVASAPTAGQYTYAAGVWTFAAADTAAQVYISYEYTATSTTAFKIAFANALMGYAPTFQAELSLPYNGHQLNIHLNNCVSSKLSLPFKNEDFSVQEFDFMALADQSNNIGTIAIQ